MSRVNEGELQLAVVDLGNAAAALNLLAMYTEGSCEHQPLARFFADLLQMYYHRLEEAAGLAPGTKSGPRLVDQGGES